MLQRFRETKINDAIKFEIDAERFSFNFLFPEDFHFTDLVLHLKSVSFVTFAVFIKFQSPILQYFQLPTKIIITSYWSIIQFHAITPQFQSLILHFPTETTKHHLYSASKSLTKGFTEIHFSTETFETSGGGGGGWASETTWINVLGLTRRRRNISGLH